MMSFRKAVSLLLFFLILFSVPSYLRGEETKRQGKVREPAVAGSFYPSDPKELRSMIEGFLSEAPRTTVPGKTIAIVSPHAGYIYSGKTAAAGYKTLEGLSFDTVIVIGPSHHYAFDGAAIYADGPYRTPLGDVPLDTALIDAIKKSGEGITTDPVFQETEHSVEVEIPFLQVVLGNFKLVPIVMGSRNLAACEDLAQAIAGAVGTKKVLIVASSDLSHYYPRDVAKKLDGVFRSFLAKNDPDGMYDSFVTKKSEACGGGPVVTTLLAAKSLGSTGVVVTKYDDSGTETGDTSAVVGYMSAVVYGRGGPPAGEGDTGGGLLSAAEKKKLLSIARTSIECGLTGKDFPNFGVSSPALKEMGAAFVTLKKNGDLRGCIGYIEPILPLWETVKEVAAEAAFHDQRVSRKLSKDELKDITIEISVLSKLSRSRASNEIVIGRDGVQIRKDGRSGIFLPQVPVEQGWGLDEYLQNLCEKAGLMPNDWKQKDARLFTFTADVFSEE